MEFQQYFAGLFEQDPVVGSVNPPGEVQYRGYERVPIVYHDGVNVTETWFPASQDDKVYYVSHVAILTKDGRVVAKRRITGLDDEDYLTFSD